MELETFLTKTAQTINGFADKHSIPSTTVWRAVKKKVLRPSNALLISKATGGIVTTDELLYPSRRDANELKKIKGQGEKSATL